MSSQQSNENKQKPIELTPSGMNINAEGSRPVLLLQSEDKERTLPVWMSAVDAGVALAQGHPKAMDQSPHGLTIKVLDRLQVQLDSCEFVELKGHHLMVDLKFSGHPQLESLQCRADEAMSFCLQAKAKFYAHPDLIDKCRHVNAEMEDLQHQMNLDPEIGDNDQFYLN